jgi:hypothetical protein
MKRLAVPSRVRRALILLAALAMICAAPALVNAGNPVGPGLLPGGATGYVHFQVTDLNRSPLAKYPLELLNLVKTELQTLSLNRIGLDVTQLSEVTVIVPPFQVVASHRGTAPPLVIAATFVSRFNPAELATNLPGRWTSSSTGNATYYKNEKGAALLAPSANTVLYGSEAAVGWWTTARQQQAASDLPELLRESIDNGQVLVGVDLSALPAEVQQQLPPFLSAVSEAKLASVTLDLAGDLTINAALRFNAENTARKTLESLEALRKQGRAALTFQEGEFQRQLANDNQSWDGCIEALAGLAVVRQSIQQLDNAKLTQEGGWVSLSLTVDQDASVLAAAALGAAGASIQNAQRTFGGGDPLDAGYDDNGQYQENEPLQE